MTPDTSNQALDALVARLRGKRERCHDLSGVYYTDDMDCQQAADHIEALRAQLSEAHREIDAVETARRLAQADADKYKDLHRRFCDLELRWLDGQAERDAAVAGAVRVTALEWKPWGHGISQTKTILGTYHVWEGYWRGPNDTSGKPALDPHMAAQADYTARILSALEPDASALTAVKAEALPSVDHLAQIIRTVDGKHSLGAGLLAEVILNELAKGTGQ